MGELTSTGCKFVTSLGFDKLQHRFAVALDLMSRWSMVGGLSGARWGILSGAVDRPHRRFVPQKPLLDSYVYPSMRSHFDAASCRWSTLVFTPLGWLFHCLGGSWFIVQIGQAGGPERRPRLDGPEGLSQLGTPTHGLPNYFSKVVGQGPFRPQWEGRRGGFSSGVRMVIHRFWRSRPPGLHYYYYYYYHVLF